MSLSENWDKLPIWMESFNQYPSIGTIKSLMIVVSILLLIVLIIFIIGKMKEGKYGK